MATRTKGTEDYYSEKAQQAYNFGLEAVRRKPRYAPSNPYDDEQEPQLYAAWDEGAMAAGICDLYTNGELNKGVN